MQPLHVVVGPGRGEVVDHEKSVLRFEGERLKTVGGATPVGRQIAGVHLGAEVLLGADGEFRLAFAGRAGKEHRKVDISNRGPVHGGKERDRDAIGRDVE